MSDDDGYLWEARLPGGRYAIGRAPSLAEAAIEIRKAQAPSPLVELIPKPAPDPDAGDEPESGRDSDA